MHIYKLIPAVIAIMLEGCSYPSNVANDLAHMGEPAYDNCRRNADASSDYGERCAKEADANVQAAKAEQARQASEQRRLAVEAAQRDLVTRRNAEISKGYSPITVRDFVLDGRDLATQQAKRSLSGVYLSASNLELLFGTDGDAVQFSRGLNRNSPMVPLLTEGSSRVFRSQLLDCRSKPAAATVGCRIHVLGTVTFCAISGPLGERRDVPCVAVDDGSVGGF